MSALHPLPIPQANAPAARVHKVRVLAWPVDPLNPYSAALHSQMGPDVLVEEFSPGKMIHRYDIWHCHWPEALLNIRNPALATFKLSAFLAMADLVRLRGGKIVWTMHNLKAHDALHPKLEAMFWRRFIPRVDAVISLSKTGLKLAQEKFPRLRDLPAAVIPHGHYRDQYPDCVTDARAALNIPSEARVILFFGEVRAYKNVDALVRAFRAVRASNALLYIAGRLRDASFKESILEEASQDSRVRLALEFIAPERVSIFFSAADLVVLPYRHILNSGSALLALSFNRPVLVPDLGSMGDLRDDFGGDWVRTFTGNLDAEELERSLDWAAQPRPSLCPMAEKYRWPSIRSETVRFYREVIHAS
jgi:beta-1,4-mannosyltransferase